MADKVRWLTVLYTVCQILFIVKGEAELVKLICPGTLHVEMRVALIDEESHSSSYETWHT